MHDLYQLGTCYISIPILNNVRGDRAERKTYRGNVEIYCVNNSDPNVLYLKTRHYVEDQANIKIDDKAELRLVMAFEKLPRIDTIEYDLTEDDERQVLIRDQMPLDTIGREAWPEKSSLGCYEDLTKQVIALLQAAYQSRIKLTTIK